MKARELLNIIEQQKNVKVEVTLRGAYGLTIEAPEHSDLAVNVALKKKDLEKILKGETVKTRADFH